MFVVCVSVGLSVYA